MRHLSCGCCDQGCTCWNHQDVPQGKPVAVCEFHAMLKREAFNPEYRYNPATRSLVKVPNP